MNDTERCGAPTPTDSRHICILTDGHPGDHGLPTNVLDPSTGQPYRWPRETHVTTIVESLTERLAEDEATDA
jgi:hypothetical protein